MQRRLLLLNLGLIALVALLGYKVEVAWPVIAPFAATVPVTALAIYLFSRWQYRSGAVIPESPDANAEGTMLERGMISALFFLVLTLGLGAALVILLAPEQAIRVGWVLPALGGNAGHSWEALARWRSE